MPIGCDFMFTDEFAPYFLECNSNVGTGPFDEVGFQMPGASAAEVDTRLAVFITPRRHISMLRWMGVPCKAAANDFEMTVLGELLDPPVDHVAEASRHIPRSAISCAHVLRACIRPAEVC